MPALGWVLTGSQACEHCSAYACSTACCCTRHLASRCSDAPNHLDQSVLLQLTGFDGVQANSGSEATRVCTRPGPAGATTRRRTFYKAVKAVSWVMPGVLQQRRNCSLTSSHCSACEAGRRGRLGRVYRTPYPRMARSDPCRVCGMPQLHLTCVECRTPCLHVSFGHETSLPLHVFCQALIR